MCLCMILFVFMNIWRWSHYGKVCSGDFLDVKYPLPKNYPDYLIMEGRFLKAVLIVVYVIIGLMMSTVAILAVFFAAKKPQSDE